MPFHHYIVLSSDANDRAARLLTIDCLCDIKACTAGLFRHTLKEASDCVISLSLIQVCVLQNALRDKEALSVLCNAISRLLYSMW